MIDLRDAIQIGLAVGGPRRAIRHWLTGLWRGK
jgi:hypothetical protein